MSDNRNYLPDHYTEVSEPFFEGRGNHSVMKLEEICEQYKEFTHQLQIKFQNASQQTASLREENERLKIDLQIQKDENVKLLRRLKNPTTFKRSMRQLREEVEQLRGRQKEFGRWLMNVGISGRPFEQLWSEFEALSSKESKPS